MTPAVLFALVTLPSCQDLEQFVPTVRFDRMEVEDIDFQHVDADFVFAIDNPNPIEVGLSSFSYDLGLEGVDLLDGTDADGFRIEESGASELALPLSLDWQDTWDVVQATRGEDLVDFGLAGHLGFMTPLGEARVRYDEAGDFPALRTPRFQFRKVRVSRLNLLTQEADLAIDLGVDNPHGSTLFFDAFEYDLDLGGRAVASGRIRELGGVEGATDGTLTLPVTVDLLRVGAEVVDALTGRDPLDVGLAATMDVDTPFGVVPLTIDETGRVSVE
jgi:LEA14-like dessication related protein